MLYTLDRRAPGIRARQTVPLRDRPGTGRRDDMPCHGKTAPGGHWRHFNGC